MGAKEAQERHRDKNRDKINQRSRNYRASHKEERRAYFSNKVNLVRKRCRRHKISVELYEFMLREQGGVCEICKNPEVLCGWPLSIDHDHTTGYVRGLLCHKCNKMLGLAKDSVLLLESAIRYLKEKGSCYVH